VTPSDSRQGPEAGRCGHNNEALVSKKCDEYQSLAEDLEDLLASHEGLRYTELVGLLVDMFVSLVDLLVNTRT
jgi:hypothetical protein